MHRNNGMNFRNIYIVFICTVCLLSGVLFSTFFLIGSPNTLIGSINRDKPDDKTQTVNADDQNKTATKQEEELKAEVEKYATIMASPYLKVINASNPLPEGYTEPALAELSSNPSMHMEEVAAAQIEKFFSDAVTAGYKYTVKAAYRTAAAQTEAYNAALQENLRAGYTTAEAEIMASKAVAKAGESEYQTGLIIEFSESRSMTAEEFMQTDFYTYIKENIHKYGFVLRYPENKEAITGYTMSPFVYRYVGNIESAEYMKTNNLSLEEYNDYVAQQKAFAEQRLSSLSAQQG
jgi:LAS superfamily LD-carboxypeptidase LdcB